MWTQTYNRKGVPIEGGWVHLREAIRGEHTPVIQVEMLEPDLTSKGNFILPKAVGAQGSRFTNVLSDGNVDVDYDRGTRRTAELTILNPSADFTPTTAGFETDGDWNGLIYINRVVRIWRGAFTQHGEIYVPVGTLMVDAAEAILEQNMSIVNLTLSDFWKKLTKSIYGYSKKYDKGTYYNAIIKDILDDAGVPRAGKYHAVIDNLSNRSDSDKRLQKPLKFQRGDSRGEILKNLAKDWNIDMYFDPYGVFRTEDRKTDRDRRVVWTYESRNIADSGKHGGLVSLTRSFNDDNLYNHVIIVGTGNEKGIVKAARQVTNENSKFHKDKIGDRVFLKESDKWSTQAQVDAAMKRIWAKRIQFSESINAEVICNPALEADDKVRFVERDFIKIADNYRLRRFNVPLVTSRQVIEATNIIRDEDIW